MAMGTKASHENTMGAATIQGLLEEVLSGWGSRHNKRPRTPGRPP